MTPPMNMDARHVGMIADAIADHGLHTVAEVGCWQGQSARELLKTGIGRMHLYDIRPTRELQALAATFADRVTLHSRPYYGHDHGDYYDMVIIDADHGWGALADLAQALADNTRVIVMHDTVAHSELGYTDCWGSDLAANILRTATGRTWVEDKERRPGEWTHRGLIISTLQ